MGHYLDSGADEVINGVIWRRTGGSVIKEWSVRVQRVPWWGSALELSIVSRETL